MGQYSQVTKTVTLTAAGGAAPSTRVFDVLNSVPLSYRGITVSSKGMVLGAGDLDWNVFYGGSWIGTPLASTSTHVGGISQNSGTIAGGAEVYELIFDDYDVCPAMVLDRNNLKEGSACVVYLENKKAVPITALYVTFVRETVGPNT
jgi:hypothetical protein